MFRTLLLLTVTVYFAQSSLRSDNSNGTITSLKNDDLALWIDEQQVKMFSGKYLTWSSLNIF